MRRQVRQCHGIELLFVMDQHVESSYVLMLYYSMMRIVEKRLAIEINVIEVVMGYGYVRYL